MPSPRAPRRDSDPSRPAPASSRRGAARGRRVCRADIADVVLNFGQRECVAANGPTVAFDCTGSARIGLVDAGALFARPRPGGLPFPSLAPRTGRRFMPGLRTSRGRRGTVRSGLWSPAVGAVRHPPFPYPRLGATCRRSSQGDPGPGSRRMARPPASPPVDPRRGHQQDERGEGRIRHSSETRTASWTRWTPPALFGPNRSAPERKIPLLDGGIRGYLGPTPASFRMPLRRRPCPRAGRWPRRSGISPSREPPDRAAPAPRRSCRPDEGDRDRPRRGCPDFGEA
jgi:hypothetical protein